MDAAIEEEPLVKAAEATELSRAGACVDVVRTEMIEECGNILLGGIDEHAVARLEEFGEGLEVAVVSLTGERAQALFYAEINLIVVKQREIA